MQKRQNKNNYRRRLLDDTFNLEKSYFYQEISSSDLNSIKNFISSYFSNNNTDQESLKSFFPNFKNLKKGEHNLKKLKEVFYDVADQYKESENFFNSFKSLNEFIHNEYMVPKPAVMEVLFFPNQSNEVKLANMIRTCKKSLYICVYTISNDALAAAIEEVYERGIEVKIITDDECCKNYGSDIYRLAAMVSFLFLYFRELKQKLMRAKNSICMTSLQLLMNLLLLQDLLTGPPKLFKRIRKMFCSSKTKN